MRLIYNNTEFEDFYPYDKRFIKTYPKQYPCFVDWEYVDAELMGDYKQIYVVYPPKKVSLVSFEKGLNTVKERL